MDALDEEKEALGSGVYVERCEQLPRDTELAFEALALRLKLAITRQLPGLITA